MACQGGHLATVEHLLTEAGDHKQAMLEADNYMAFRLACRGGHLATAKHLLTEAGDHKQAMLEAGNYAAFWLACRNGHLATAKHLLTEAGDHKQAMLEADRYMAFRLACRGGHLATVEHLLTEATIIKFFADELLATQENNKQLFINKLSEKCQEEQFSLNEFALWQKLKNSPALLTKENITS